MENIKASTLKTREQVVRDLTSLLMLVDDCKEACLYAADTINSPELATEFLKLSGEKIVYADELKENIKNHSGDAVNGEKVFRSDNNRIIGGQNVTGGNAGILNKVISCEKAAIEKYDELITDYVDHADHLQLLIGHRYGLQDALDEIELLKIRYISL